MDEANKGGGDAVVSGNDAANPVLVELMHGNSVESHHRGMIAIVDSNRESLFEIGNVHKLTCIRSALKPLQSIPLILSGASDAYHLDESELALACSSHNGETQHIEKIRKWLGRISANENRLLCGAVPPIYLPARDLLQANGQNFTQSHNGCSGKHTGYLTLARHLKAGFDSYCDLEHPVQKLVLQTIQDFLRVEITKPATNIDFCNAPNLYAPFLTFAQAFSQMLGIDDSSMGYASRRILRAMKRNPQMIGGTERFCSLLTQATNGSVVGKMGAGGTFLCLAIEAKLVILINIDDGSNHAAELTACHILNALGLLNTKALASLQFFIDSPMQSSTKREIGSFVVCQNLLADPILAKLRSKLI